MSVFRELINGKGNPNFKWVPTIFEGNVDAKGIATCDTYADALKVKVNHPKRNNIVIEMWYRKAHSVIDFLGDETDMLNLEIDVNKICIIQKKYLSL